jgi:hypothetical protein
MSPQNQWRLDLAKRIAPIYTEHPNVQVIVVGGSVSYGLADCYSDVEIGLFWSQTPSIETRKAFANRIGIAKDFEPWNKHGDNGADEAIYIWGDQKTGFQFDIKHRLSTAEIESLTNPAEGSWEFWQYAIPIYGHELAQQWREETVPPHLKSSKPKFKTASTISFLTGS